MIFHSVIMMTIAFFIPFPGSFKFCHCIPTPAPFLANVAYFWNSYTPRYRANPGNISTKTTNEPENQKLYREITEKADEESNCFNFSVHNRKALDEVVYYSVYKHN